MRILIFGNYGNGNNGDEVVLMAMLREMRLLNPSAQITVVSGEPDQTRELHNVRAIRRGFSPEVIHAIAETDVVIIGGGGILIDQVHSNLKYGLVVLAARLYRKPIMVYGIGVDAITKRVARVAVRSSFNMVDLIALRDNESRDAMLELGVTGSPIHVTADPAFTLDRPRREDFRELLSKAGIYEKASPLIGISIWPTDNLNSYQRIPQVFAALSDRLVQTYDSNLVFLVMSTIGFEGDLDASLQIVEMMRHGDRARVLGVGYHPEALMAVFGQMDLVIGMRYHSLVLSTIMEVPLIGIERAKYPKNTYFLREVHQLSGGLAENLTVDHLEDCVAQAWQNREEMSSRIAMARRMLYTRASKNIELFGALATWTGKRGKAQSVLKEAAR
jgi:polysaccharide pyruvyl transferase CsaB